MTEVAGERTGYRQRLGAFIESDRVGNAIIGLILINAVVLGLQTSRTIETRYGDVLNLINQAILGVFVVEIVIKFVAFRFGFFKSGWNVFDFLIVVISLVPTSDGLDVLRALRVLRLLRLISQIPKLREIIESIGRSLSGLFWTAALLLLIFYIFGVMGTMLFRDVEPEYFGNLGRTIYTLFQIMTLESWSHGIARGVMAEVPLAWMYFVPFILIASFMVLNLFIAIIVNATNSITRDEDLKHQDQVTAHLRDLSDQVAALHARLDEGPAARSAGSQRPPEPSADAPAAPGPKGSGAESQERAES